MAKRRISAYDVACDYLDGTGQPQMKDKFDSGDIELMRRTYKDLEAGSQIEPVQHPADEIEQRSTIMLDRNTHMKIRDAVYLKLPQNIMKWQEEENNKNKELEYGF